MADPTGVLDLDITDVGEATWEDLARSATSPAAELPPTCIVIGCDGACCCSSS